MNETMMQELKRENVVRRKNCRHCQTGPMVPVVSLGEQYVVDFVSDPDKVKKPRAPLNLEICSHCRLVQLGHSVNADLLYKEFWYRSGINEMMRKALADITLKAEQRVSLKIGDAVLDIGCNDGTLLDQYKTPEIFKAGIDPSNVLLMPESKSRMSWSSCTYFDKESAFTAVQAAGGTFKVITAIAMFYDLEDPHEFLKVVKTILDDEGVLIIQMNYLGTMLKNNAFDNICHEHLTYYSLDTLRWISSRAGFDIVDVEENDVNGGSIRVYLTKFGTSLPGTHDNKGVSNVARVLESEQEQGLFSRQTYLTFGKRVERITHQLSEFVIQKAQEGTPVWACGASTRGSTLLQSMWPSAVNCIAGASERDERKFGKYTVGTWLKIFSEEDVRRTAKYQLVLPWHFKDSILEREKQWAKEKGGKLIIPLPTPMVYELIDDVWKTTPVEELLK